MSLVGTPGHPPPNTHPGEADAADGPTQHVREHGRVRAGRGEVGEEVGTVPVGHLCGTRAVTWGRGAALQAGGQGARVCHRESSLFIEKPCSNFWPEVSARGLPLRSHHCVMRLLFLKLLQKLVYIRKGKKERSDF